MLPIQPHAIETFSGAPGRPEKHFREGGRAASRPARPENQGAGAPVRQGDEVVFERLDLAEALGIWRKARGRVVGIHRQGGASVTVDVQFQGYAILERYLPDLFRRAQ